MIKIYAFLLCVCVYFGGCTLNNNNVRETCDNCVPIGECKAALPYMELTEENLQFIAQYFCGITTSFNVCCSMIKEQHPSLKRLPNSCGKVYKSVNYRITAGSFVSLYEFPWMVLISYKVGNDFRFKCSGTLINSRYVLTAAHCVVNLDIAGVRVGEHEIGKDTDCVDNMCESNLQDIAVEEAIPHENYKKFDNNANDIALLRLAREVDMSFRNTGTICLPISMELQHRQISNVNATVAGWGHTEHLRDSSVLLKVNFPVKSDAACQNFYSFLNRSEYHKFCAGAYRKDSCKGDSGGPLMIEDFYNGKPKVIQYGIVSSGPIHCGSHRPGLYTDVRKYVDWILDNIKD